MSAIAQGGMLLPFCWVCTPGGKKWRPCVEAGGRVMQMAFLSASQYDSSSPAAARLYHYNCSPAKAHAVSLHPAATSRAYL